MPAARLAEIDLADFGLPDVEPELPASLHAERLALEHASCRTSNGVPRLLTGLRPGMTEREAIRAAASRACHDSPSWVEGAGLAPRREAVSR